jgi:purine nucleosidase
VQAKKKVILDTDIGTDCDDALALALCLLSPEIDLLGVSCVYGDVALRAKIAHKIIGLSGKKEVPVYEGMSRTIMNTKKIYWAGHEGRDIVDEDSDYVPNAKNAVDFIIDTIMDNDKEITVIAIGPLTNIAVAMLKEPRICDKVKEIITMGGVAKPGTPINQPNGTTYYLRHLEHNYQSDPEATKIVLESGAHITMVGLDVTLRTRITPCEIEEIGSMDSPLATALFRQMNIYSNHVKRDWLYMHDPLAVGVCLDPTIVRKETASVKILLIPDNIAGHVIANFNVDQGINICTEVDNKKFLQMFLQRLKEHS